MADDDIIRAGAVILGDLALFNRSVVFYEKHVEPVVRTAIGELVADWAAANGWRGEWDVSDGLSDMRLYPAAWEEDPGEKPFGIFTLGHRDESASDSFEIPDLFGVGETDFGFWFEPEYSWYGGKSKWNAFVRGIGHLLDNVAATGWLNQGKGVFFLPVPLRADGLASAWADEDWSGALAPLTDALDSMQRSRGAFDAIILKAAPKSV